jgi:hypothetical protein
MAYLKKEDGDFLLQENGDKILLEQTTESASESRSPSLSLSPSGSISLSPSVSPSASPSYGYAGYTKGDYAVLPADDSDLEVNYTGSDVTNVSSKNDVYVDQTATEEYILHQYKNFVSVANSCDIEAELKSSLAPTLSTVYLQIYNRDSSTWETIDSDNTSSADTDFILTASVVDLTNYKDATEVISCRIYQLAL